MSNYGDEGQVGVGPAEAQELIEGGALLVDVRENYEWEAGHAPMARHLPLGQLPQAVADLPVERRYVVVCRSGQRSARATAFLRQSGFDALNLDGGMQAWAAAGLPLEAAGGGPGAVA